MKYVNINDSRFALLCIQSGKATEEESAFLDTMRSMCAANEPVPDDEYRRLQRLTGGVLSTETPICER